MEMINTQVIDYSDYDIAQEVEKLKQALQRLNLKTDEKFFSRVEMGDTIEIYSYPENRQLYRNEEFSRFCSYSAEQMSDIAFPKLFWRSDEDQNALVKRAAQVALRENGVVSWGLPNHELVESLHPRKRTYEIKMGSIAPCFDAGSDQRVAWVSTVRVLLVFEWDQDI